MATGYGVDTGLCLQQQPVRTVPQSRETLGVPFKISEGVMVPSFFRTKFPSTAQD